MNAESIDMAAQRLVQAWRSGVPFDPLSEKDLRPATRADALAIQAAFVRFSGERIAGWKIGATSAAVQKRQNLDGPIPGRILEGGVYEGGRANVPASRCRLATIECEIGFRFRKTPPRAWRPVFDAATAQIVDLHFAVEVTGSRYAGHEQGAFLPPYDLIADNGGGAAFVFSKAVADWPRLDLANLLVDLRIGDRPPPGNFLGEFRRGAVDVLGEVLAIAEAHGQPLTEGQFVSTGSIAAPQVILPGQTARVDFGGSGSVELVLAQ
jgi:2-keto-4-pentenoate hydratase